MDEEDKKGEALRFVVNESKGRKNVSY